MIELRVITFGSIFEETPEGMFRIGRLSGWNRGHFGWETTEQSRARQAPRARRVRAMLSPECGSRPRAGRSNLTGMVR